MENRSRYLRYIPLLFATILVAQIVGFVLNHRARVAMDQRLNALSADCRMLREEFTKRASAKANADPPDSPTTPLASETNTGPLTVYFFADNARSPSAQAVETQVKQTLTRCFGQEMNQGALVWQVLNYEQPDNAEIVKKFDVQMPVAVVALMKDGRIERWQRLDRVWALLENRAAFEKYLCDEVAHVRTGIDPSPTVFPNFDMPK